MGDRHNSSGITASGAVLLILCIVFCIAAGAAAWIALGGHGAPADVATATPAPLTTAAVPAMTPPVPGTTLTAAATRTTVTAATTTVVPAVPLVPQIVSVTPATGPVTGGTLVRIDGTGLSGVAEIRFNNTVASFTKVSDYRIIATAPAGAAGPANVTLYTHWWTGTQWTGTTSAAGHFAYYQVPVVSEIRPAAGPAAGGTEVSITGAGFNGTSAVRFGTVPAAYTLVNDMLITAWSTAGSANTVDITVTTPYGTSAASDADQFTYYPAPVVTGISPASGPTIGGTTVTIDGTGFDAGTPAVLFGTTATTDVTVNSATRITATSPAVTAGTVDITVSNTGGTSAASAADQFTFADTPSVTSVTPSPGPAAGGFAYT